MPVNQRSVGNGAIEALSNFLDHIESIYGKEVTLTGVSQSEFTGELLSHLWVRGYKVTALEPEDLYDH